MATEAPDPQVPRVGGRLPLTPPAFAGDFGGGSPSDFRTKVCLVRRKRHSRPNIPDTRREYWGGKRSVRRDDRNSDPPNLSPRFPPERCDAVRSLAQQGLEENMFNVVSCTRGTPDYVWTPDKLRRH